MIHQVSGTSDDKIRFIIFINLIFKSNIIAPGDYTPEKSATSLLDTSPKYSFGMKTQVAKPSDTPGKINFVTPK